MVKEEFTAKIFDALIIHIQDSALAFALRARVVHLLIDVLIDHVETTTQGSDGMYMGRPKAEAIKWLSDQVATEIEGQGLESSDDENREKKSYLRALVELFLLVKKIKWDISSHEAISEEVADKQAHDEGKITSDEQQKAPAIIEPTLYNESMIWSERIVEVERIASWLLEGGIAGLESSLPIPAVSTAVLETCLVTSRESTAHPTSNPSEERRVDYIEKEEDRETEKPEGDTYQKIEITGANNLVVVFDERTHLHEGDKICFYTQPEEGSIVGTYDNSSKKRQLRFNLSLSLSLCPHSTRSCVNEMMK